MSEMKVIEVQVRVMDTDEDEKWQEDPDYEPERICITFEDLDPEFVYMEADEIKRAIERIMSA